MPRPERSSPQKVLGGKRGGGDFGGGWAGSCSFQALEEQAQVGFEFGEEGEDDLAAVGCQQMHVDHLHGGELRQRAARPETRGEAVQASG